MARLFEEMHIGPLAARNRLVRAATAESLATSEGSPTQQMVALYEELARGGVGTLITGYCSISPDGKPSEAALCLHDDSLEDDYRRLVRAVHGSGAKIVLQLVYGGSKSRVAPDDPRRLVPAGDRSGEPAANVSILGASELENPKTGLVPKQATADDLARVARDFAAAATRARDYGFDGVEVHAAHGYLLSQFLSRRFNVREDAYGGSLENRARLALDCVAAVRGAVGADYPVLVKVNSCDDAEDPLGAKGGLGEDESARVCAWLARAGASCIEVSGDWHGATPVTQTARPLFAPFGARIAAELRVPVIVTGGWRDFNTVEEHLQADGIEGIGMCRPLICEPDLPNRWREGHIQPSACTACGNCQKRPGIPCPLRLAAAKKRSALESAASAM